MYSFNARRNEASPNRMNLDRHSCRTEHTQRSAKAFRFGLLGGRANGRIPLDRRTSKYIFLLSALAATVTVASADTLSYVVAVNTPNFGAPGWIDFSFNQANAQTRLPATATISNFQQTGYTLDAATQTSGPGVTGTLIPGPVVIPNDEGARISSRRESCPGGLSSASR